MLKDWKNPYSCVKITNPVDFAELTRRLKNEFLDIPMGCDTDRVFSIELSYHLHGRPEAVFTVSPRGLDDYILAWKDGAAVCFLTNRRPTDGIIRHHNKRLFSLGTAARGDDYEHQNKMFSSHPIARRIYDTASRVISTNSVRLMLDLLEN